MVPDLISNLLLSLIYVLDLHDLVRAMQTCRRWMVDACTGWRKQQRMLLAEIPVLGRETDLVREQLQARVKEIPEADQWLSGLRVHSAVQLHDDSYGASGCYDEGCALLSVIVPTCADPRAVMSLWGGGCVLLLKWVHMISDAMSMEAKAEDGPAMMICQLGAADTFHAQALGLNDLGTREHNVKFHVHGNLGPVQFFGKPQWPLEIACASHIKVPRKLTAQEEVELQQLKEFIQDKAPNHVPLGRAEELHDEEERGRLVQLDEIRENHRCGLARKFCRDRERRRLIAM